MATVKKYLPPIGSRPICENDGCSNERQFMGTYRKDGSAIFRRICAKCHGTAVASKHGLKSLLEVVAKNAGFTVAKYQNNVLVRSSKKAEFSNITAYLNSKHVYRQHRETFCENIDGRLGFECKTKVIDECMLDVDHINNNHDDNKPANLHTLCKCCHAYKTKFFGRLKSGPYIKRLFAENARALVFKDMTDRLARDNAIAAGEVAKAERAKVRAIRKLQSQD